MRKLSSKLLLLAAGALLLLFLTNNFGLIDIQKTAIVTAIGIDAGEGGTFDVTAQIAIPDAGGANTASNVAVPGAETVGEAIAELNRKTGWFPTLVHCSLILLGERAAEEDVFRALDYFLRSEYVEDSCLVALCADTAAAALGAGSPIGELASAAIAKVLSAEAQKTGLVSVTNLRDFAKGYFAEGQSGFLPTLRAQPRAQSEGGAGGSSGSSSGGSSEGGSGGSSGGSSEGGSGGSSGGSSEGGSGDSSGGSSEGGSGGGGGSGGQSSAGGGQKSDVFDAAETALFFRGRRTAALSADETLAYNLAVSGTDMAFGDVTVFEEGAEVHYQLKMNIGKKKRRLRLEGGVPVLTFTIRAQAQAVDADRAGSRLEIAQTAIVPDHVLRAAEQKFERELRAAAETAHAGGCDLFSLQQMLHRFYPKQFDALRPTLLQSVRIACDIRFATMR